MSRPNRDPSTPSSDPAPRSLDAIFSPRSVAVVGASRNRGSIGYALLHNLLMQGFEGPIYPVNPKAEVIHSIRCHPDLASIPDPVDLAVIVVPRDAVLAAVDQCVDHGVRALVVISAGFAETGPEGAALEAELQRKVREAGIRMVGPNCMGVLNTDPRVSLDATFSPTPARPGSIGFVSQSGALGVAILNVAAGLGLGLTQFASMGNKTDVSGNDLLEYWEHDDTTRLIAMYLESFGNPRRFAEIAKRVSRRKPILMVKSGRTEAGARAASSHTGAMAGLDVTVAAFLAQCGVVRANTIEELFDVARAFDRCPLPAGGRVAIVTNAGGPGIMATDACVNLGLEIATLTENTHRRLGAFLPAAASLANPVDMIASADPDQYRRTVATVLDDPTVDALLVINVTPLISDPRLVIEAVAQAVDERSDSPAKPVLAVVMARDDDYRAIQSRPDLPPVYRFPESAALALAKLAQYARWRREQDAASSTPRAPFETDDVRVAEVLGQTREGFLPPEDALAVLDAYGIPVVPWRLVDGDQVLEQAEELGYPLVLKAVGPDLIHKSDLGAVAVDLRSRDELVAARDGMVSRLDQAGLSAESFLLQRFVRGGHEVIFGISTDERFGPLLMFGLGGKYVEVFRDVRFAITPLERHEAEQVVRGIQGLELLQGVRGDEPVDLDLLVEILLRLAQLVGRHPRIRELDVNPFLASADPETCSALDVRIRVAPVD